MFVFDGKLVKNFCGGKGEDVFCVVLIIFLMIKLKVKQCIFRVYFQNIEKKIRKNKFICEIKKLKYDNQILQFDIGRVLSYLFVCIFCISK